MPVEMVCKLALTGRMRVYVWEVGGGDGILYGSLGQRVGGHSGPKCQAGHRRQWAINQRVECACESVCECGWASVWWH